MEYNEFFHKTAGYNIIKKVDGSIVNRCGFFHKYQTAPSDFDLLFTGLHPDYKLELKSELDANGYRFKINAKGETEFCGTIEGAASPSRLWQHCPDDQPPALKRVYDKGDK